MQGIFRVIMRLVDQDHTNMHLVDISSSFKSRDKSNFGM